MDSAENSEIDSEESGGSAVEDNNDISDAEIARRIAMKASAFLRQQGVPVPGSLFKRLLGISRCSFNNCVNGAAHNSLSVQS